MIRTRDVASASGKLPNQRPLQLKPSSQRMRYRSTEASLVFWITCIDLGMYLDGMLRGSWCAPRPIGPFLNRELASRRLGGTERAASSAPWMRASLPRPQGRGQSAEAIGLEAGAGVGIATLSGRRHDRVRRSGETDCVPGRSRKRAAGRIRDASCSSLPTLHRRHVQANRPRSRRSLSRRYKSLTPSSRWSARYNGSSPAERVALRRKDIAPVVAAHHTTDAVQLSNLYPGKVARHQVSLHSTLPFRLPDDLGEEFDAPFARLDWITRNRFDLQWHRHTAEWFCLHRGLTLAGAIDTLKSDGLLYPL